MTCEAVLAEAVFHNGWAEKVLALVRAVLLRVDLEVGWNSELLALELYFWPLRPTVPLRAALCSATASERLIKPCSTRSFTKWTIVV